MTLRRLSLAILPLVVAATARAAGGYDIVTLGGDSYQTSSLVFTKDAIRAVTPAGARSIARTDVDWYQTFRRNVQSGATNVVVFRNRSLLRFDRFELEDGRVTFTIGSGRVTMLESLIDFEASVREGAMVKLPEGAGATVAVSRSSEGGGAAYQPPEDDGGGMPDDVQPPAASSRTRRSATLAARRRAGMGGVASAPEDGLAAEQGEMPPEEGMPVETDVTGRPPGPNPALGRSPRRPGNDSDQQQSGQATVVISTDYSGPIAGIQLTLQYPPTLQVVEPVTFTGFASNWMSTPNATVPGQIVIGGVTTGTEISGGEFFKVTFVWTGQPPARQLFRITAMKADGATGDFRTTMDVMISP